jgi:hypothetical protein
MKTSKAEEKRIVSKEFAHASPEATIIRIFLLFTVCYESNYITYREKIMGYL